MKAEHINAFLAPIIDVIEKTIHIEASIGNIKRKTFVDLDKQVTILIEMNGDLNGFILLSIVKKVAVKIAASMFNSNKIIEFNKDVVSALSELGNMIIGNITGSLYEIGLKERISVPALVLEGDDIPEIDVDTSVTIPVETELGLIDFILCLTDERAT